VLRAAFILAGILVPALALCADDDDSLAPVTYHGSVSVTSQQKAHVQLVTGEAKRHSIDEDLLPHWVTKGSWESRHPSLDGTFGAQDEELFAQSFVSELVHLGLFKQAAETNGDNSDDVHIRLSFAKTEYFYGGIARYVLNVEMQIEAQGTVVSKRYVADSRSARSLVKGEQYGRGRAKTQAATDLMEKLIPDVEEWVGRSEGARTTETTSPATPQDH
jgi:hypothetical protein